MRHNEQTQQTWPVYLALCLAERVGEHFTLNGQVTDPQGGHEGLDAVPAKYPEQIVL